MRAFAPQKPSRETKPASFKTPGRGFSVENHALHPMIHLRRGIGNQAIQRVVQTNAEELEADSDIASSAPGVHDFSQVPFYPRARTHIQPKLTVGTPGDMYEQEADRVADQVMRMREPGIQRMCSGCGDEVRNRPIEEEELLQAEEAPGQTPEVTPNIEAGIVTMKGGGRPLPPSERAFFEPRFGRDLSSVRIHTGAVATETARAINARAYTLGNDMIFSAQEYRPGSLDGRRLLAHELTHVVQQQQSSPAIRSTRVFRQEDEPADETAYSREDAERIAWEFYELVENASSVEELKSQVETKADGDLGFLGADAVVISLSGSGGEWLGAGGGFEALYSPRFGWAFYGQVGVGFSTPGGAVALEVGLIWDLKDPADYEGAFIELAGTLPVAGAAGSVSGTVVPEDIAEFVTQGTASRPRGIKVGGGGGGAGVALLAEWYCQLNNIPDCLWRLVTSALAPVGEAVGGLGEAAGQKVEDFIHEVALIGYRPICEAECGFGRMGELYGDDCVETCLEIHTE